MSKAKIKLIAENKKSIDFVIDQIREIAKVLELKIRGPIYLPTKKLKITTRKTPCGDGSDTYEHWEKRLSKRIVEVEGSEKVIRQILRIKVPDDVFVKILLE